VNKIYEAAKKSNNEPQIIKALLFKITLEKNIKEDASEKAIYDLEREILVSKEPSTSILQSITAQMYWQYFQDSRYKIYNLTNTVNFDKKDIATWTADDFSNKISALYLASLKNISLLQSTKLAPFDAIIKKGNSRQLRPTLFDLLAHRALDYFTNDERNITKPSYAFEIDNPKAFAPVEEFISTNFKTKDSASLHHKALLIYQKLLAFHQNDTNKDALIDVDIQRLNFVNQYGVMADKEALYINALKYIGSKYSNNPTSSIATFLLANQIYQKALSLSEANNSDSTYTVKKAKTILEELVNKYPKSDGGIQAQNLLNEILSPSLSFTTEKVNVPNIPFRSLVKFKNISQIYLRIIPLTDALKQNMTLMSSNEFLQKLTREKSIESWTQPLPFSNDFLNHSTEIKVNGLPIGEYILLSSNVANFDLGKNIVSAQTFYVSNISFINNKEQYFVLDRTTGKPLNGATIQVWNQQYDYDSRKYITSKKYSLTSDINGYFQLPKSKDKNSNRYVRFEINYKNDHLFLNDLQYISYNYFDNKVDEKYNNQKEYDKANAKVFLFTDRSIYRPGQIVYYKGIGVSKDYITQKSILLQSKDSIKVYFLDANSEKIDSINVVLNDFSSFNGKFRIPENKLNGTFTIRLNDNNSSTTYFSVEEYKRPKFYTEFEKPKGSYRLKDTIEITGFAKAYAGNNIDGALVKYKVTRVARFLYPWMFWRKGFPTSSSMEITHGEIISDVDGKFSIKFAAIPDLSLDKNTLPVFDYTIEADVTDINGETRSGTIMIPVGYQSLNLQISVPKVGMINIDSLKNISISSKNLSGEFESVKTNVKIYQLITPERLIRERLWPAPDLFTLSKNEFIQYFPHDEYMNETKKESWDKEKLIFEKTENVSS
ncbi:MAG: MG2 domain-containing protein, partial [Ginsengibacter sp.]